MSSPEQPDATSAEIAGAISEIVQERGLTVATAESLTSGLIASYLGAAPSSAEWFRGGIVAYSYAVKRDLLGVPEGPVVSAQCVEAMARAAAELTGADLAVAVTGSGGPSSQEGEPPGTVFVGIATPSGVLSEEDHFEGEPATVVEGTAKRALEVLHAHISEAKPRE